MSLPRDQAVQESARTVVKRDTSWPTVNVCIPYLLFVRAIADIAAEKQKKDPNVVEKAKPVDPKPFIFLDVSVLREYLAVELVVPGTPFPFNLELAIDDWIFMIFFVGNDFLPHLPSLEIREGAIDALLKIWKSELGRMGGYLTNHGKVDLARAQVILEGLAKNEDSIFQRRREGEFDRPEPASCSTHQGNQADNHRRGEARLSSEASTYRRARSTGCQQESARERERRCGQ